jgi:PPE-repeat protein
MDFAALPPEINSARIYAGPGVAPLMEASVAWQGIATQLSWTASAIAAEISALESVWSGPSSSTMATTMTSYATWLTRTAGLASDTAARSAMAAAAFEAAWAATVPPPEVAANRALHSVLVATNFLGINTPAIMATEAQYMEMWAQDAAAMFGYQAEAQAATTLEPFTPPTPFTGASVAVSPIKVGLGSIFTPGSNQSTTGLAGLLNLFSGQSGSAFGSFINSSALNTVASSALLNPGETWAPLLMLASLGQAQQSLQYQALGGNNAPPDSAAVPANGGADAVAEGYTGRLAPSVSAGTAQQVGALSTPQSWGQTPYKTVANAEPIIGGTPQNGAPMAGVLPGTMARGTTTARGPRYGVPVKVVPRLVGS